MTSTADARRVGQVMRVLLVEDDFLVGTSVRCMLRRFGCEVVGPIATVAESLAALDDGLIRGGILDINIVGGTSAPVAERLLDRGDPVIIITGYRDPPMLPDSLQTVRRLQKPIDPAELHGAFHETFGV